MTARARGETGRLTREVAAILRARLARLDWTQTELAARSGVSQSHLSQILKGRRHIYIDQLESICEALGLDVAEVIGDAWKIAEPRRGLGFGEAPLRRDPVGAATDVRDQLDDIKRPESPRPAGERPGAG